ncbi:PepSY domain-containing protein [Histidinibacterium lentulum]|uniref:PepSY domain-containing protein n=1 Tax=Histidinibacterium lentulum TaxID=2480588 RepID=A0A3N2QW25_9RHOB|nr:PepSY domain-containing protein [Histidinibacterium lentulum]ROT99424.1 PepSY domain-containing protein [Histidinibacterium lentulum]
MIRTILVSTVAAAATLALSLGAVAEAGAGTTAEAPVVSKGALSTGEIATRFEAQGYVVREIDRERSHYEVYLITPAGQWIEAYVDPVTGETRHWEYDDDRYDDD